MSYYDELMKIKPKKIIHCGAHICDELEDYENIKSELVVWVEANQEQCSKCKAKLENKQGHILINKAIYNKDNEKLKFKICNQIWASSLFDFGEDINKYWSPHNHINEIEVESITIDTIIKEHNLNYNEIDLLCLDIQGAEVLALEGAKELLKYIKNLYIEVVWADAYSGGARKSEVEDIIFPLGFNECFRHTHNDGVQADILYRR